jgi:excisionase family DNA binding protein
MANAGHFEPLLNSEEATHQTKEHHRLQEEVLRVDGVDKYRTQDQATVGVLKEESLASEIERPLSATELAPMIGLHSVTILRWAREGRIPHHRLSARKIVFLPSEINHWLASGSGLYPVPVGHAA